MLDHYGLPITRKSFQAQQLLADNSSSGLNASAFFGKSVFEKFNSAWKRLKSTKKNLDTYFEHDKSFYRARELVRSNGDSIDLREFSEACRGGFAALRTIVR